MEERELAIRRHLREEASRDAFKSEEYFYKSRFSTHATAQSERSYFLCNKRKQNKPPITEFERIRKKTKIPTIHSVANFSKSERKNLNTAVGIAMRAALFQEVEEKLVLQRELCNDDESELEKVQSWAKDEFRKIREEQQLDTETVRRLVDKLNWKEIALQNVPRYTGTQCYIHYIHNEAPWCGKRFGKNERVKMKTAIVKHGTRGRWVEISKEVDKNISPFKCLQEHMRDVKAKRSRLPWTKEEDDVLLESVRMFGSEDWSNIANATGLSNRNSHHCLLRWKCRLNPNIKRGRWVAEEDLRLLMAARIYHGMKSEDQPWSDMSALIKGRIGPQCAERFKKNLNPNIKKTKWTSGEIKRFKDAVAKYVSSGHMFEEIENLFPILLLSLSIESTTIHFFKFEHEQVRDIELVCHRNRSWISNKPTMSYSISYNEC